MLAKTQKIKERYEELTKLVVLPEVIQDSKKWQKLCKERSNIEEIANHHDMLAKAEADLKSAEQVMQNEKDSDMKQLAYEEIGECKEHIAQLEKEIKVLLLPKDENDDKNVIIEIRPAAGGEESALFSWVLMKMYTRYAERMGWVVEPINISETELGGIKEAVFSIKGKNAYSKLKYESGVHRVQRVPETESQGRIHTSTATVAVLPEIEEVDFEILDKDIKIDTYRSSGAGGQKVNKTETAIRIVHLPTNTVVCCQDERSQMKNREKAMNILKSKLYDFYQKQIEDAYSQDRKNQVGTGNRNERIRTYNYPQGRIADHRINYTAYNLAAFLDGDMQEMIDELIIADQKAKLEKFDS